MPIVVLKQLLDKSIEVYGPAEVVAHALYEMTFFGYCSKRGTGLYISEIDSRNAISSAVKFLRYVIRFIKDKNREKN